MTPDYFTHFILYISIKYTYFNLQALRDHVDMKHRRNQKLFQQTGKVQPLLLKANRNYRTSTHGDNPEYWRVVHEQNRLLQGSNVLTEYSYSPVQNVNSITELITSNVREEMYEILRHHIARSPGGISFNLKSEVLAKRDSKDDSWQSFHTQTVKHTLLASTNIMRHLNVAVLRLNNHYVNLISSEGSGYCIQAVKSLTLQVGDVAHMKAGCDTGETGDNVKLARRFAMGVTCLKSKTDNCLLESYLVSVNYDSRRKIEMMKFYNDRKCAHSSCCHDRLCQECMKAFVKQFEKFKVNPENWLAYATTDDLNVKGPSGMEEIEMLERGKKMLKYYCSFRNVVFFCPPSIHIL